MTTMELLEKVRGHGVQLVAAGGVLRYHPRAALPAELRQELLTHKSEVLELLRTESNRGCWSPLIPAGWHAGDWRDHLTHLAKICDHADRAADLREHAGAVAETYGLDTEVEST